MSNEDKILAALSRLEQGQSELRQDVTSLKQDVVTIKQDVSTLKQDVTTLKQDVTSIKGQQTENTVLIKALIQANEVTRAEHDSMKITLANVEGGIIEVNRKVNLLEIVSAENWSDIARLKAVR